MPLLTDGGTGFDLLENEPKKVNGVEHNDGVHFGACFGSYKVDPAFADFRLGGRYAELRATAAIGDMTPSPFSAELEFRADDVVVGTTRVAIGDSKKIRVPLQGADRLRVLFTPLEGGACEGAVFFSPVLKTVSDLKDPPTSPKVTDLRDLEVVAGEWTNKGGSAPINGKIFPRSLALRFCFGPETQEVEYTIAGYKRLVGHVGVSDLAPSPWRTEFRFLVNQRPVKTYWVSSGARAVPINVPLTSSGRLLIRVITHETPRVLLATTRSLAAPSSPRPGFWANGAATTPAADAGVMKADRPHSDTVSMAGQRCWLAPPGFACTGLRRLGDDGINAGGP